MKIFKLPAVLLLLVVQLASSQNTDWSTQTFGTGFLYDVFFIDSLYGWTVGTGGRVYGTTDGGLVWTEQIHVTNNDLNSVFFLNRNIGFAVGNNSVALKTTNGGAGWSLQSSLVSGAGYSKVHFRTEQEGWCLSPSSSAIRHSTDGGASWQDLSPSNVAGLSDLQFLGATQGWALGSGDLLHTMNGIDWTFLTAPNNNLVSLSFISDSVGFIVRASNTSGPMLSSIYGTTDAGNSWSSLDTLTDCFAQHITFLNDKVGWLTGWNLQPGTSGLAGGCVYKTIDGGVTWNRTLFLDYENGYALLYRGFFLSEKLGWAVGRSSNGPPFPMIVSRYENTATAVTEVNATIPTGYFLTQNYPNPFNPATRIDYALPASEFVTLKVYNMLGQEVAALVNEVHDAGYKSVAFEAANLPSGVYTYRLTTGPYVDAKKMVLLR
jgi:photosystem II stability/assembly factor-like uncharacterized protein